MLKGALILIRPAASSEKRKGHKWTTVDSHNTVQLKNVLLMPFFFFFFFFSSCSSSQMFQSVVFLFHVVIKCFCILFFFFYTSHSFSFGPTCCSLDLTAHTTCALFSCRLTSIFLFFPSLFFSLPPVVSSFRLQPL